MKPKSRKAGAPTGANHSDAPAGKNTHSMNGATGIVTDPPFVNNFEANIIAIARRRLKTASDPRSRLVNALALVSLKGGGDDA